MKEDKSNYTKTGRIIDRAREAKEWTIERLVAESGVSRSAIYKVMTVEGYESRKIPAILAPLGLTMGQLERANIRDDMQYPEYSLDDAPVCIHPYILRLDSAAQLYITGLDLSPCSVICVPWDQNAERTALLAVFRLEGHQRASIVSCLDQGDDRLLVLPQAAKPAPQQSLQDGHDGQVLAAIHNLTSQSHLFYRRQ